MAVVVDANQELARVVKLAEPQLSVDVMTHFSVVSTVYSIVTEVPVRRLEEDAATPFKEATETVPQPPLFLVVHVATGT